MRHEVIEYTHECEGIAEEQFSPPRKLGRFWNDHYELQGYGLTFIEEWSDHSNPRLSNCMVYDIHDGDGPIASITVRKLKNKITYRS